MTTATPLMTHVDGDVTQTTYELSEPITYKRWHGERFKTMHVIVSHARYNGTTETAVFPGSPEGKVMSYIDLFMSAPACDDVTALKALDLTPTPPVI